MSGLGAGVESGLRAGVESDSLQPNKVTLSKSNAIVFGTLIVYYLT